MSLSLKTIGFRFFCSKPQSKVHKIKYKKVKYSIPNSNEVLTRKGDSDIDADPYHIKAALIIQKLPAVLKMNSVEQCYHINKKIRDQMKKRPLPAMFLKSIEDQKDEKDKKGKKDKKDKKSKPNSILKDEKEKEKIIQPKIEENKENIKFFQNSRPLYLIVKKDRTKHNWQFPQGNRFRNETIAETALRQSYRFGENLKIYLTGNAPIMHHIYDYDKNKSKSTEKTGAKVFFIWAHYIKGYPELNLNYKPWNRKQYICNDSPVTSFKWATKNELKFYLDEEIYFKAKHILD